MEIAENFITSILTEGIVITLVCYSIGEFIKRSGLSWVKKIKRDYIPIIVVFIGMSLSFIPEIFPNDGVGMSILKGFICGAASTGVFESYKKYKKSIEEKEKKKESEEEKSTDETING